MILEVFYSKKQLNQKKQGIEGIDILTLNINIGNTTPFNFLANTHIYN